MMKCSRAKPFLPLVLALASTLLAARAPEALAANTTTTATTTTTTLPPQNEMWVIPSVGTSRQNIGNWEATNQQDARFDWILPDNADPTPANLTAKLMMIPGVSQTLTCTLSFSVAQNAEARVPTP